MGLRSPTRLQPGEPRSCPEVWVHRPENRRRWRPQLKQQDAFALLLPFCSIRVLSIWIMPTCIGEGDIYSVYLFKWWFLPETPSRTQQMLFYQLSGHPLPQSSLLIKLIIAPPNQELALVQHYHPVHRAYLYFISCPSSDSFSCLIWDAC